MNTPLTLQRFESPSQFKDLGRILIARNQLSEVLGLVESLVDLAVYFFFNQLSQGHFATDHRWWHGLGQFLADRVRHG